MKVIIDRFEGEYAVVEILEGNFALLPKVLIPAAQEGDIISIQIEKNEAQERQERIQKLMDDLWEN